MLRVHRVCHAGFEPQTSRPQTGLLLTRASLALDRATAGATPASRTPSKLVLAFQYGGGGSAEQAGRGVARPEPEPEPEPKREPEPEREPNF